MACPACDHRFSIGDSLRLLNPTRFGCPGCRSELSVGPAFWALLAVCVACAYFVATHTAERFNAGAWNLTTCLFVLLVPIVASGFAEFAYLRVGRLRSKPKRSQPD